MRIVNCWRALCLACALFAAQTPAWADEPAGSTECIFSGSGASVDAEKARKCIDAGDFLGKLDLAAPANPLFALMGSAPETVIKPKPGDKAMLSLLPNIADQFGGQDYGFGVELNPSQFMLPKRMTAGELQNVREKRESFGNNELYDEHLATLRKLGRVRVLHPISISAALSKKTGDSDIFRAGVGVMYNFDPSGPLYKNTYGNCLEDTIRLAEEQAAGVSPEAAAINAIQEMIDQNPQYASLSVDEREKIARKKFFATEEFKILAAKSEAIKKQCAQEASKWNRPIYGGGAAFYYSDVDAPAPEEMMGPMTPTPAGDETGFGVWLSASRPNPISQEFGQVTVHARYTDNLIREREVSGAKMTESVDGWSVGGRVTHQIFPLDGATDGQIMRGFIEAAYTEEKFGTVDDDFVQAGVGLELQLRTDLFFQIIVGDTFGSEIDRKEYLSGQIKWSFSKLAGK